MQRRAASTGAPTPAVTFRESVTTVHPMPPPATSEPGRLTTALARSREALADWGSRQVLVALAGAVGTALLIGFATVLIPNPVFGREIPPVWWDYPVWVVTSLLCGVLIATYVDPNRVRVGSGVAPDTSGGGRTWNLDEGTERRTGRMGMAGGVLAWFAVGCPVCNKIALLALGYSGAMTWFAPMQPILAAVAILFTSVAIVLRLEGQVVCRVGPTRSRAGRPV